jgi:hypothetical protein
MHNTGVWTGVVSPSIQFSSLLRIRMRMDLRHFSRSVSAFVGPSLIILFTIESIVSFIVIIFCLFFSSRYRKNRFSGLPVLLTFNSYTLKVGPDPHESDGDPTQNWSVFRLHIPHCHFWTRTHSTALDKLKCSRTLENISILYRYNTNETSFSPRLFVIPYLYYAGCRIQIFFCHIRYPLIQQH